MGLSPQSVQFIASALAEKRLNQADSDAAEKMLADKFPSFRRMQKHARVTICRRVLQQALRLQESSDVDPNEVARMEISDAVDGEETAHVGSGDGMGDGGSLNSMLPYTRKREGEQKEMPADDGDPERISKRPAGEKKRRRVSSVGQGRPDASKQSARADRPSTRFADVGGIDGILEEVRELIELPLLHVELYKHLGVDPPRGVLLHGPPGCGKTLLANAIAGEIGLPYLKISAPEIVSGMSGDSERKLRDLFAEAKDLAPCLMFIDEVDAICSRRESANKDMERRIVAQLLTCLDDLELDRTGGQPVLVLGATNRPDSIDPALRRAGRFDRELEIGAPDEAGRNKILRSLSRKLRFSGDLDFLVLARMTAGYVGADLSALTTMAATVAVRRIGRKLLSRHDELRRTGDFGSSKSADSGNELELTSDGEAQQDKVNSLTAQELADLFVTMEDFLEATKKVQPSALREGFTTVPDVTWEDIGALQELRTELSTAVVEPIRHPEKFEVLGLLAPAGVLLYGPPGCGKTLLAKAVARESSANFISVKGPELLNKFVGESERSVRRLFQRARASSPCVVFFDELDALAPRRSGEALGGSDSGSTERVVNQLLTELDGIDSRKQVFVIAATNRPDIIDPAMLRPGRLDKLLYVPLPSAEERALILRAVSSRTPLDGDVDLKQIGTSDVCSGFSGADLAALVREATVCALRSQRSKVCAEDFQTALTRVFPSISSRDARLYRDLKGKLRESRVHIADPSRT